MSNELFNAENGEVRREERRKRRTAGNLDRHESNGPSCQRAERKEGREARSIRFVGTDNTSVPGRGRSTGIRKHAPSGP